MRSSKRGWYHLQNANRKPEVELQRTLSEHSRLYAQSKRDWLIEQGHLWDTLFHNSRILRTSLTRVAVDDFLSGAVRLDRRSATLPPVLLPSEYSRQFIIFKVKTSLNIFGDKAPRRPHYADLYHRQRQNKENNARNVAALIEHCQREAERENAKKEVREQTTIDLRRRASRVASTHIPPPVHHLPTTRPTPHVLKPPLQASKKMHQGRKVSTIDRDWLPPL